MNDKFYIYSHMDMVTDMSTQITEKIIYAVTEDRDLISTFAGTPVAFVTVAVLAITVATNFNLLQVI